MSFQDVAFLPPLELDRGGRGESLRTATYLKTVVGGKQGHAPCKVFPLQQSLFLSQSNLMEIIRLLTRMR